MFDNEFMLGTKRLQVDEPVSIHAVYERAAFVIDHYAAAYIVKRHDEQRNRITDEIKSLVDSGTFDIFARMGELPGDYHDVQTAFIVLNLWGVKAVRFTGTYLHIRTELPALSKTGCIDVMTRNEPAVFIPASKTPKLFSASYGSPADLAEEYASVLSDALPPGFDYWRNICYLSGNRIEYK